MFIAIVIVHVLVCLFLVFVVLLQTGRGAELGAAFGGMGQATFGRGQSTFITKFTTARDWPGGRRLPSRLDGISAGTIAFDEIDDRRRDAAQLPQRCL